MANDKVIGIVMVVLFAVVVCLFVFVTIRSSIRTYNYKRKLMTITDDVETLRKAVGYKEELVKKLSPEDTNDKCEVLPSGEIVCPHCGYINDKQAKKCVCCNDKIDI